MQEQHTHVGTRNSGNADPDDPGTRPTLDGSQSRKPSAASASSAANSAAHSAAAESAKSRESGSSHNSSTSLRKPTGFTIPDPVSVEEHGRTFNAYREGKYLLPNDAVEQERLDLAHEMWRLLLFGDLAWVPFADEPRQVLDIGTGTGIWAIEFAQQHPASNVIGTDISLIQPPEGSIPSNCTFERDDVEEEWVFDRLFDYIHLRAMLTCFNDHVGVVQRIYDNLRPGGWVEYHDYDPEVFGKDEANQRALLTSAVWDWSQRVFRGAKRFGRDMMIARQYKKLLMDAGFVDVTEKIVLAPNKPWSDDPRERRIGQYMQANSVEMIGSVSAKLFQADGMSLDEVDDLVSRCLDSFQSKELHLYSRMCVVYGRKPSDDKLPVRPQTPEAPGVQITAPATGTVPREGPPDDELTKLDKSTVRDLAPGIAPAVPIQPVAELIEQDTEPEVIAPLAQESPIKETTSATRIDPDLQNSASLGTDSYSEEASQGSVSLRETAIPAYASQVSTDATATVAPEGTRQALVQPNAIESTVGDASQFTMEPAASVVSHATTQAYIPKIEEPQSTSTDATQVTNDTAVKAEPTGSTQADVTEVEPIQGKRTYEEGQTPTEGHTASQAVTASEEVARLDQTTKDYHDELGDLSKLERKVEVGLDQQQPLAERHTSEPQLGLSDAKQVKTTPEAASSLQAETSSVPSPETRKEKSKPTESKASGGVAAGRRSGPISMTQFILGRKAG